jgi:type II secretion system protein N
MTAQTRAPARAVRAAGASDLPRWVFRRVIPFGAAALTLLFVVAGFPYDRLAPAAAARISAATGARVTIADFGPTLGLLGLGVRAAGVRIAWPDGSGLQLDDLRVRPAWSLSWLRGRPALAIQASGPLGRAEGTAIIAGEPGFDGRVSDLDLSKLPIASFVPGASIEGHGGAEGELSLGPAGVRGELALDATDGSIALPNLPVALPYTTLRGDVKMTDAALLEITALELDGPLLALRVNGSVGRAVVIPAAPLNLELHVMAKDPAVRPLLAQAGLRVGEDGSADLRLTGTAAQPLLR